MASIRKSFSFRNGVQVDEDNFIVNANGLVGIGTSVPSEFLDVRGTAKVVGLVTASDVFVSGVATITDIKVGSAISITDGGIAASRFFGDGATLSNLPTSQWEDVNLGLGFTSIYAIGNVGIATTDPRQSFQVGGDPAAAGKLGVGINSIGNIRASGIITASSFVGAIAGPVTGDVTGNVTGNLTGNVTGNIDGLVNATGVSTFTDNVTFTGSSGNVSFNKSDNSLNFGDNVKAKFGIGAGGDAEIFHDASTGINDLRIIDKVGNLKLETATNKDVILRTGVTTQTNLKAVATQGVELYFTGNKKFETTNSGAVVTGILTATETSISEKITVGTGGTALTSTNTGRVGVGTAIPSSDVTIKKESATTVEVVAETGVPNVSIGLTGETKNKGILRFGSESNTLDIINNDTGDLNFIIDGDSNSGSGNFKFVDNVTERARITNDGKLGIAITNPAHQLHVVGTSTVTGNTFVGGNLSVGGTITGTLALGNLIEGTNLLTTSGISTFNQVNFTNSVGFGSAIPKVDVDFQTAVASFSGVGIGTTNPGNRLKVVGTSFFDTIGVNTTAVKVDTSHNPGGLQLVAERLYLYDSQLRLDLSRQSKIGFGTAGDTLSGSIDLRKAGGAISPWAFLPEMTTSVRNTKTTAVGQNASGIGTGAVIYNTTTKRVEIYLPDGDTTANVTNWVGIATV